jgi:hypothetical protein
MVGRFVLKAVTGSINDLFWYRLSNYAGYHVKDYSITPIVLILHKLQKNITPSNRRELKNLALEVYISSNSLSDHLKSVREELQKKKATLVEVVIHLYFLLQIARMMIEDENVVNAIEFVAKVRQTFEHILPLQLPSTCKGYDTIDVV